MNAIYVILPHPTRQTHPLGDWVQTALETLQREGGWEQWQIRTYQADQQGKTQLNPIRARIQLIPGPILLLGPVSPPTATQVRQSFPTFVTVTSFAHSVGDLVTLCRDARTRFDNGEPLIPRRRAAAIVILRDLNGRDKWCGHSKGYHWWHLVQKNIGATFSNVADDVVNLLKLHQYVISKPSQGKPKYGCNPKRRAEIQLIVTEGKFVDRRLLEVLDRDATDTVPASELVETRHIEAWAVYPKGASQTLFANASAAISRLNELPDGPEYIWEIRFDAGQTSLRGESVSKEEIRLVFEAHQNPSQ